MSPVDTGQMTPPVPIPGVNPTQIGGPPQSPALGTEQLGLPPGLLSAMPFTVGGAPGATPGVVGAVPRPPMNAQPPQSGFMQDVARQHEALGPLSPDEEAQFGAGVSMAARTQDPDSFSKTVTKIVEDRKDRAKEAETARHNRAMEQTQSDRPGTRTVVTGKGVFQYNP